MSTKEQAAKDHIEFLQKQVELYANSVDAISHQLTAAIQRLNQLDPPWVKHHYPELFEERFEEIPVILQDGPSITDTEGNA